MMAVNPSCERAVVIMRRLISTPGAVTEDAIVFLRTHLAHCDACLVHRAVLRGVVAKQSDGIIPDPDAEKTADAVIAYLERSEWQAADLDIFSRPSHRIRRVIAAVAAAVVVLGITLGVWKFIPAEEDETSGISIVAAGRTGGDDSITPHRDREAPALQKPPRSSTVPVSVDADGDRMIETSDSECVVLLPAGIEILLGPRTTLIVKPPSSDELVTVLRRGAMLASVDPRRAGPRFHVITSEGRITVTGTIFSVTVNDTGHSVSVLRGQVTVTAPEGHPQKVESGRALLMNKRTRHPLSEGGLDEIRRATDRLAHQDGFTDRIVDLSRVELLPAASAYPQFETRGARHAISSSDTDSSPPALQALLTSVRKHQRQKEWEAAAAIYRNIVRYYPRSSVSAEALVALGNIQLEKLNRPEVALKRFEQYLMDNETTLAEEALIGKAGALRRLGRISEERHVLERLLSVYPSSLHAATARERLKKIAAEENRRAPDGTVDRTQQVKH